jgi:hypothetical protein
VFAPHSGHLIRTTRVYLDSNLYDSCYWYVHVFCMIPSLEDFLEINFERFSVTILPLYNKMLSLRLDNNKKLILNRYVRNNR